MWSSLERGPGGAEGPDARSRLNDTEHHHSHETPLVCRSPDPGGLGWWSLALARSLVVQPRRARRDLPRSGITRGAGQGYPAPGCWGPAEYLYGGLAETGTLERAFDQFPCRGPVSQPAVNPGLTGCALGGAGRLAVVLPIRRRSARQIMGGLAILFLTGCLALDLRWQRQLASRLVETYERNGHLPVTERPGARTNARIAQAVGRTRQALPAQPTRLFILSKDPSGYVTHRARYHFLPHRVFATDRLPSLGRIHGGDHLLVLAQPEMARYDQQQGLLINNKVAVPVEFLDQVPGFGTLYRVKGGK